jgi:hypothetical protein
MQGGRSRGAVKPGFFDLPHSASLSPTMSFGAVELATFAPSSLNNLVNRMSGVEQSLRVGLKKGKLPAFDARRVSLLQHISVDCCGASFNHWPP